QEWEVRLQAFAAELAHTETKTASLPAQITRLLSGAQQVRQEEAAARDELAAFRTQLAVAEEGARHRRAALQAARAQQAALAEGQSARAGRLQALTADLQQVSAALENARREATEWAAVLAGLQ